MKWQPISNKFSMVSVGFQMPKNGVWWTCWLKEWNWHNLGILRRLAALLTGWGRRRSKVNIEVKSQNWHQRFPRFLANLSPLKMPTPALVSLRHHCSALTQPTVSSISHPTGRGFPLMEGSAPSSFLGRGCELVIFGPGSIDGIDFACNTSSLWVSVELCG